MVYLSGTLEGLAGLLGRSTVSYLSADLPVSGMCSVKAPREAEIRERSIINQKPPDESHAPVVLGRTWPELEHRLPPHDMTGFISPTATTADGARINQSINQCLGGGSGLTTPGAWSTY